MDTKSPTNVIIVENGPMFIRGEFEMIGRDGAKLLITDDQKSNGVAVCRCGKSQNAPYCDGSHIK